MRKEHLYKPHDKCKYPFTPYSVNYCWSWAACIDKKGFNDKIKDKFIKDYCCNCEFFKEN